MIIFLISLIILNIFVVIFFNRISIFINLFDIPDNKRKIHSKKIPSIGGFVFLLNIFFFLIYYLFNTSSFNLGYFFTFKQLFIFYIFLFLFFLIGVLDDKFDLSSNIKLILSFILIYSLIFFDEQVLIKELYFSFFNKKINIQYASYLFSAICFLLFINAFNMFDGINLQSTIYAFFLFLLFLAKGIFMEISLVLMISLLFFAYLNYKNRCFMGDNGTLLISFILSYFFVKAANVYKVFLADEIFLLMLIPGLDLIRLALTRVLSHKHPFKGDRNHIHHILLKKIGFPKTLLLLLLLIIAPNILSFIYGGTLYFIVIVTFIYFFLIIFFNFYKKKL
jgi:UDP-GlcNAc:undecaprenyl-phosphate GlcNAc-1-phosphate transferase